MVTKSLVRKNEYRDSVVLMRISMELEGLEGVKKASVMMGTDNNKQMLKDANLFTDEACGAGSNDLIIAVDATSEALAGQALSKVYGLLAVKETLAQQLPADAARVCQEHFLRAIALLRTPALSVSWGR